MTDNTARPPSGFANPNEFKFYEDNGGRPLNPRGHGDTTDLQDSIAEISELFGASGILTPVAVRIDDDGGLWVIDGHRRVKAAIATGEARVPYVAVPNNGDPIVAMLVSGVRQEFPVAVLDGDGNLVGGLAYAVRQVIDTKGITRLALSRIMGERHDTIGALYCLGDAPVEMRRAVASGRVGLTVYARVKYADKETQKELVAGDEDKPVTLDTVRRVLRKGKNDAAGERPDIVTMANGLRLALEGAADLSATEKFSLAQLVEKIKEMMNNE